MKVIKNDEMFDGQLVRAVGHMYEGGADYGECHSTAGRIKPHDVESWYQEWHATAERIELTQKRLSKRSIESALMSRTYVHQCTIAHRVNFS